MDGSTVITCLYIFLHIFMLAICDDSRATIVSLSNNKEEDAETLHSSMEHWGTKEDKLINILGARTSNQRKEIADEYEKRYEKTLVKDIEGDTSGDFKDILVKLTYSIEEFLAREINWSLEQKKDWSFLEIICTCDGELMPRIKSAYLEAFSISLPQEIENKVRDAPTRLLLLRIIGGFELPPRSTEDLNDHNVKEQIKCIPEEKENCRLEKNGNLFSLLSKESFAQIRTVVKEYESSHKDHSVAERIKENCEDESLRMAYTTIVTYAEDPAKYYASVLRDAMHGMGTKENVLIRVIIWRSEIDLSNVAQAFHELTHKSLEDWVKGDTSGDFKKTLLKIIEGNKSH